MKTISISEIRNLILNQEATVIKFDVINPKHYSKTTEILSFNPTLWYKKDIKKQTGDVVLSRGNKEFNLSELERMINKHVGDKINMWYTLNGTLLGFEGVLAE
jgi:hypothetical protein